MNYAVLRAELTLPAYAGMTDAAAADALNAPIAITVAIPTKSIRRHLSMVGKLGAIQLAARGTDATAALAQNFLSVIEPGAFNDLDAMDPAVAAAINGMGEAMIQAGLFAQSDLDAIWAFADGVTSRAGQLGWPTVSQHDVAKAWSL